MVLRVSGTIPGYYCIFTDCDFICHGLQFAFSLSLAHRTSSTASPLTAVETLFGALDVATEQVTTRLLEHM